MIVCLCNIEKFWQYRDECVKKHEKEVREYMEKVMEELNASPKKHIILKKPNTSKDFMTALEYIAACKYDIYADRTWYSRKKVRFSKELKLPKSFIL